MNYVFTAAIRMQQANACPLQKERKPNAEILISLILNALNLEHFTFPVKSKAIYLILVVYITVR